MGNMTTGELMRESISRVYRGAKKIPAIRSLMKTAAWRTFRYKVTLLSGPRSNYHFTRFLRMPSQYEALAGPVLDRVLENGTAKELRIAVIGCSTGAEAYSISSVLLNRRPGLAFTIHAADIEPACVNKAISAFYTPEEVLSDGIATREFISETFDRVNGQYLVKDTLRAPVHFAVANVLDAGLLDRIGPCDIVYVQQLFIHLERKQVTEGFKNIHGLMKPGAALFIAGIDLDLLVALTRAYNLVPCTFKAQEINDEIEAVADGWPYIYWGREPFMTVKKDWQRRYSTIFFRAHGRPDAVTGNPYHPSIL